MRFVLVAFACLLAAPVAEAAQPTRNERALMKLSPEERAQQACVARGIDAIRRDKRLKGVDRVMPDTFGRAQFDGTAVSAKGAAVRAGKGWYALSFDCKLADDQLKVTAFSYQIGDEIPPDRWEDVGLW